MSFRDELSKVIAGSPRYSIEAYAFVLESLQLARSRKLKAIVRDRKESGGPGPKGPEEPGDPEKAKPGSKQVPAKPAVGHVSGQEVCESARRLAVRQFGFLARMVLESWGIRETSDMGEIVYSLIESGHLEKTRQDRRADFNEVYDFATAFQPSLASLARRARDDDSERKAGN